MDLARSAIFDIRVWSLQIFNAGWHSCLVDGQETLPDNPTSVFLDSFHTLVSVGNKKIDPTRKYLDIQRFFVLDLANTECTH